LKPGARRSIERIAQVLERHPERSIIVEGFTDSTGDAGFNQRLSEERAESVKQALIDAGVAPGRILTRGYGEAFPVASNDTAAGRQLNRRVQIVLGTAAGTAAAGEGTAAAGGSPR
jgi:outer membrane protein OmpA-like peptidoglycan-associated protein